MSAEKTQIHNLFWACNVQREKSKYRKVIFYCNELSCLRPTMLLGCHKYIVDNSLIDQLIDAKSNQVINL
jgi:hypothetical protein